MCVYLYIPWLITNLYLTRIVRKNVWGSVDSACMNGRPTAAVNDTALLIGQLSVLMDGELLSLISMQLRLVCNHQKEKADQSS